MRFLRLLLAILALAAECLPASAIESIRVPLDSQAIDLTRAVESYSSQGDRLQVSTAPGSDGIVRRIEVRAKQEGARPSWIVFALTNDTDEQIERLLVAPHYRLVGSGVIWPDLGAVRINAITASQGFPPEQDENADADVFRITLDPGTTVTYVAELRTPNLPQLYLWDPDAYKDRLTNLTLYKGIVIGIAGLLALFLTIVVVVKSAVIFPAAAALAWAVFAYVCIDFGFFARAFGVGVEADRFWRASAETILSATLVVFLFAYLNLNRWHVRASHVVGLWVVFLLALLGLASYDPSVAAGVAHISLATVAGAGLLLVVYLATHGYERAIMLIPTWFLLLAWVCAAGFAVTGAIANDIVAPTLIGGLVLIVMLIGFTVMQNAFASGGLAQGAISDVERKALAVTGANDVIFDWDVPADHVYVSPEVETHLGLERGDLEGPASAWLEILHPFERDRYRACLDTLLEQRRGRVNEEFRLRASDGHVVAVLAHLSIRHAIADPLAHPLRSAKQPRRVMRRQARAQFIPEALIGPLFDGIRERALHIVAAALQRARSCVSWRHSSFEDTRASTASRSTSCRSSRSLKWYSDDALANGWESPAGDAGSADRTNVSPTNRPW